MSRDRVTPAEWAAWTRFCQEHGMEPDQYRIEVPFAGDHPKIKYRIWDTGPGGTYCDEVILWDGTVCLEQDLEHEVKEAPFGEGFHEF